MSTLIQPKQESIHWGDVARSFNSLIWFDTIISFVFRFMAKVSEPLLAAGVIISAIDFLQRGQLLAHNPELSLWWSVAQGVAMEVSIGPVLMNALDAREDGDTVKMRFYAVLSAVLAIVGSAMLLMQFGLSVAGLTESQIVPWLLWTLFAIRTVASIGYIALSCTKHKRFSGVSPQIIIARANTQFDEVVASLAASQQHYMQSLTQSVSSQIATLEAKTHEHIQEIQRSLSQEISGSHSSLNVRFQEMESTTQQKIGIAQDEFLANVSSLKSSLDEQAKHLQKVGERTLANVVSEPPSIRQFQKTNVLPNTAIDKKTFVIQCLTEHPAMTGADIQRKASEQGLTISAGYISDIRKQQSA